MLLIIRVSYALEVFSTVRDLTSRLKRRVTEKLVETALVHPVSTVRSIWELRIIFALLADFLN